MRRNYICLFLYIVVFCHIYFTNFICIICHLDPYLLIEVLFHLVFKTKYFDGFSPTLLPAPSQLLCCFLFISFLALCAHFFSYPSSQ